MARQELTEEQRRRKKQRDKDRYQRNAEKIKAATRARYKASKEAGKLKGDVSQKRREQLREAAARYRSHEENREKARLRTQHHREKKKIMTTPDMETDEREDTTTAARFRHIPNSDSRDPSTEYPDLSSFSCETSSPVQVPFGSMLSMSRESPQPEIQDIIVNLDTPPSTPKHLPTQNEVCLQNPIGEAHRAAKFPNFQSHPSVSRRLQESPTPAEKGTRSTSTSTVRITSEESDDKESESPQPYSFYGRLFEEAKRCFYGAGQ